MAVLDCPIQKQDWMKEVERDGFLTKGNGKPQTQTDPDAGPWQPAIEKIVSFQALGDDWDGCGAKQPSREMLESAIGLAHLLHSKGVPAPCRVAPGIEGEVIFEWQDPDGTHTDIEIVRPFFAEVMLVEPGKPARHWTFPTE